VSFPGLSVRSQARLLVPRSVNPTAQLSHSSSIPTGLPATAWHGDQWSQLRSTSAPLCCVLCSVLSLVTNSLLAIKRQSQLEGQDSRVSPLLVFNQINRFNWGAWGGGCSLLRSEESFGWQEWRSQTLGQARKGVTGWKGVL
jgi:hypothetical protein